jgi:mono/diheme cytochrome c family protein
MTRFAIAALLLHASTLVGDAKAVTPLAQRGQALLARMCAECHSIGHDGHSPHAGAPPLRELDRRVDLDAFGDCLREGLQSSHEDMPMFRFSRDDARAVVDYLRSIQAQ